MKKTVTALAAAAALAAAGVSHAAPLAWTKAWTYEHAATNVAAQTSSRQWTCSAAKAARVCAALLSRITGFDLGPQGTISPSI